MTRRVNLQDMPPEAKELLEEYWLDEAIKASLAESQPGVTECAPDSGESASAESSKSQGKRPGDALDEDGDERGSKRMKSTFSASLPSGVFQKLMNILDKDKGEDHPPCLSTFSPEQPRDMREVLGKEQDRRSTCNAPDIDPKLVDCLLNPAAITTTFDSLYVSPDVQEALESVTLFLREPSAGKHGILSRQSTPGVLLYGHPGTGKTQLVRAFAKLPGATCLTLSRADIQSCMAGEAEKKIKQLFTYARRHHPCFITIDDAHFLFGNDSVNVTSRVDIISQFLAEMDGIRSQGAADPIVIAATSRPYDIDKSVLRRLGVRIMVDMPDTAAREQLLKIHLEGETLADDVDVGELAKTTKGYTGCDIKNLVWTAANSAENEIRRRGQAVGSSSSSDNLRRVLSRSDFDRAKRTIPPSESSRVSKMMEFHMKFGRDLEADSECPEIDKLTDEGTEVYIFR